MGPATHPSPSCTGTAFLAPGGGDVKNGSWVLRRSDKRHSRDAPAPGAVVHVRSGAAPGSRTGGACTSADADDAEALDQGRASRVGQRTLLTSPGPGFSIVSLFRRGVADADNSR